MQKKLPIELHFVERKDIHVSLLFVLLNTHNHLSTAIVIVSWHCRWRSFMRCIVSSGGCVREQSTWREPSHCPRPPGPPEKACWNSIATTDTASRYCLSVCVWVHVCPTVVTSVLFERTSRTDWSQVWNSLPLWEVEWSSEATFSRASSHYEGPPHHTPTSPLFFQNHDLSESSLYQTGLDISWPVTLKLKFCSVRQFCLLLFSI